MNNKLSIFVSRDEYGDPITTTMTRDEEKMDFYGVREAWVKWDGCCELRINFGYSDEVSFHVCNLPLLIESLTIIAQEAREIYGWDGAGWGAWCKKSARFKKKKKI